MTGPGSAPQCRSVPSDGDANVPNVRRADDTSSRTALTAAPTAAGGGMRCASRRLRGDVDCAVHDRPRSGPWPATTWFGLCKPAMYNDFELQTNELARDAAPRQVAVDHQAERHQLNLHRSLVQIALTKEP